MTVWTRNFFGASLVVGMGVAILAERLPAWWGPASLLAMVLAASVFLTCSVMDHRREQAARNLRQL